MPTQSNYTILSMVTPILFVKFMLRGIQKPSKPTIYSVGFGMTRKITPLQIALLLERGDRC